MDWKERFLFVFSLFFIGGIIVACIDLESFYNRLFYKIEVSEENLEVKII